MVITLVVEENLMSLRYIGENDIRHVMHQEKMNLCFSNKKIENCSGRCNLGFLISWNGFAETIPKEMLRGSREIPLIVLLKGEDIKQAVQNDNFFKVLTSAFDKAITI